MNAAERGDELADFVRDEIDIGWVNEAGRRIMGLRVIRRLAEMGIEEVAKSSAVVPHEPMSDMQARDFEASIVPFGQYRGAVLGEVPLSYFCSLSDPSPWMDGLRRYLKNERVQRQLDG